MNQTPEEWLTAARAGSYEALGRALESCRCYLLQIARDEIDPQLQVKGGASDIVQETFVEAVRGFDRFEGDSAGELRAWLRHLLLYHVYKLARRYRATQKRASNREVSLAPADPTGGIADHAASPSGQAIANEQAEVLTRALARLPEDYRNVIIWRYQEQRSFDEIAARLQRSETAVRKVWARALERLQLEMKAENECR